MRSGVTILTIFLRIQLTTFRAV